LSESVEKINSTYLAKYEEITVKAILIGENCISIDTHWLLTTNHSGFRGIIMKFIQNLSDNDESEPKEPLEEQLVSKGILVTDCMKFVLSPTTYKKRKVWDEVFNEGLKDWTKSLPKIGEGITVGFAYKRVFDRFTQNDNGKKWLVDNKASSITYYDAKTHKWITITPKNGKNFTDGDFNHIKVSKPQ